MQHDYVHILCTKRFYLTVFQYTDLNLEKNTINNVFILI